MKIPPLGLPEVFVDVAIFSMPFSKCCRVQVLSEKEKVVLSALSREQPGNCTGAHLTGRREGRKWTRLSRSSVAVVRRLHTVRSLRSAERI